MRDILMTLLYILLSKIEVSNVKLILQFFLFIIFFLTSEKSFVIDLNLESIQ